MKWLFLFSPIDCDYNNLTTTNFPLTIAKFFYLIMNENFPDNFQKFSRILSKLTGNSKVLLLTISGSDLKFFMCISFVISKLVIVISCLEFCI